MKSKRLTISKYGIIIFSYSILFIVLVYVFFAFLYKKYRFFNIVKVPVIGKWFNDKKLKAQVYEPQINEESNANNPDSTGKNNAENIVVPTTVDLKIGSFKKLKIDKPAEATGKVSTAEVSVKETDNKGNVKVKTAKAELKICRAGTLKGWIGITVPYHTTDILKPKMARIKAPLFSIGSPFALIPLVKNAKSSNKQYLFAVAKDWVKLASMYNNLTKSYVKNNGYVDKKQVENLLTFLLVRLSKTEENKNKGNLATILESAFMGGLSGIPFVGKVNSRRVPGSGLKSTPQNDEDAYRQFVHTLIFGPEKGKEDFFANSPEAKACREFLKKKLSDFTFKLEATELPTGDYKTGVFTSANGKVVKNLFKSYTDIGICKGNNCYLALQLWGHPEVVLFNQLNICFNALAHYTGQTKIPGEKDSRVVNTSCEGIYCKGSGIDKEKVTKKIATAIVFDISGQKPFSLAVLSEKLAAMIQDPFGSLFHINLSLPAIITSPGENGFFRKSADLKTANAVIPIKVTCKCPKMSKGAIVQKWMEKVPDWAKPLLKVYINAEAATLSVLGIGVEWNCTFEPGSLLLSSGFDTTFSKVSPYVANASLSQDVRNTLRVPNDFTSKYDFATLAQGLGRLQGCNLNNSNKKDSDTEDIKNEYLAHLGDMPILLHQRVYFDTVPPPRAHPTGSLPAFFSYPSVFNSKQDAFLDFPVYSEGPGSMVIKNVISQIKRIPDGKGEDVPDTTFYKVLFCYMGMYFNTPLGHMQFSCKNGSNTAEADFVSDVAKCASIKPEDYIKVAKMIGIDIDNAKVAGQFNDVGGIFKKD